MRGLWLPNLKKFITGTLNGSKYALDVHVANTISTAATSLAYKERRLHLGASTTIPKRSSNMVQLDANSNAAATTPADVANTVTELGINWNGGDPIEIGVGANAAAAAAAIIGSVGAGQTRSFGVSLVSGNKIWVRALKDTDLTDGELLVTLLG